MNKYILFSFLTLFLPNELFASNCGGFCYTNGLSENMAQVVLRIVELQEEGQTTRAHYNQVNHMRQIEGLPAATPSPLHSYTLQRESNRGKNCQTGLLQKDLIQSIASFCRVEDLSYSGRLIHKESIKMKENLIQLRAEHERKLEDMIGGLKNSNVRMSLTQYENNFKVLHKNLMAFFEKAKAAFFQVKEKNRTFSYQAAEIIGQPGCSDVYNVVFPKHKENLINHCHADQVRGAVRQFVERMKRDSYYIDDNEVGFIKVHARSRKVEADIAYIMKAAEQMIKSVEQTLKTLEQRKIRAPASEEDPPLTGQLLFEQEVNG